jgi:hypothetical protein
LFLKMITYSPKSLNKFANLDIDIDIPEPEEYGLKDVLDEILKLKRLDIGFTYYKKKIKKVLNLMDPESEKWKGEIKRDVKYIGYNVKSSLEDIQDKVRVLLLDSIKKGKCDITAG